MTIVRRKLGAKVKSSDKSWVWPGSAGSYVYAPFGVRPSEPIIITAGERDCLALGARGLNAVCFTNGESAVPPPERLDRLLGSDVVLAYDNDEGNHSRTVASRLLAHVASARIAQWPSEVPHGHDVSDVLADDRLGMATVERVLADAMPWGEADALGHQDEAEFEKALARALTNERVRDRLAVLRADAMFTVPSSERTLKELLAKDREPLAFTIADLHPEGSNALIAAQYKVGKTTLVANLAKSYADGDKFLGHFPVAPGAGRIAIFNYELTEDMLLDEYLIPLGIENPDRISVLNLRGLNFDLRSRSAFEWGVGWLKERDCDALILDPYGAAARLTNENDSSEARNWLLGTLDPFKEAAGIRDLWMPAHTGRAEKEEGSEHVRGASSVDDWADIRWLYTRAKVANEEGETSWRRFLSAAGRGVDVSEREIRFDKDERVLYVGDFKSRAQARSEGASVQAVRVAAGMADLNDGKGPNTTTLQDAMKGETGALKAGIKTAIQNGWLSVVKGANNAKFHTVTDDGRAIVGQL